MTSDSKVKLVAIDRDDEGQRLDNFLMRKLKGVPKSRIYRLLRKGEVRLNKKRCKPSDRLSDGDVVRIPPVRVATDSEPAIPSQNLQSLLKQAILFEDDALLVLNKPSGLAVHGGSGLSIGLIESLRAMRPDKEYMELVHRLDRETSGCLMIARSRKALVALHAALREGSVHKEYLALAEGKWPASLKTVDAPLQKNQFNSGERMVRVEQDGKQAITHFSVEQRFDGATLVKAVLETGRTHQIRVHAQVSGHPLVGDEKYGDRERRSYYKSKGLKRLFLHAALLEFDHPISRERISVEAPLPEELTNLLNNLEN